LPVPTPKKNRSITGQFIKGATGNPNGRPKGKLNPVSYEIKAFARQVLLGENPQIYLHDVRRRIMKGQADHMEKFFAEHLWGKPKERIEINLTEQHLMAVRTLSDLELSAFLAALDAQKPDEALRFLPGSAA
jgi:hypothetical protein